MSATCWEETFEGKSKHGIRRVSVAPAPDWPERLVVQIEFAADAKKFPDVWQFTLPKKP